MGSSLLRCIGWIFFIPLLPSIHAQEITFELFGTQDGLPSASVTALAQDQAGHLWIGTDVGLVRYNGYEFQTFYSDSAYVPAKVNALTVDSLQTLWIGTTAGLSLFQNGKFQRFTAAGLDTVSVQCLLVGAKGQIIVSTLYHLYVIHSGSESGYLIDQYKVTNPLFLGRGMGDKAWICTPTHLMTLEQGQLNTVFSDPSIVDGGVVGIYEDEQGLLFGTDNENVNRLNIQTGQITSVLPYDNYYDDFHSFARWGEQTWAVYGWGIAKLLKPSFETLGFPAPWNIKFVNASLVDRENNFWIGSTEGLILARKSVFKTIADPALASEVYSVCQTRQGTIWLGGNRGWIFTMDEQGTIKPWDGPKSFGGEIMDIEEDGQGSLWLASFWQGLILWNQGVMTKIELEEVSPIGPDIYDIHLDQEENLWLGTTRGLFSKNSNPHDHRFTSYEAGGLSSHCDVFKVITYRNLLWIASSCGLFRIESGKITSVRLPNLGSLQIRSIFADQQHLWIGTLGYGLRCYTYHEKKLNLVKIIDRPDRTIFDITGNDSNIWAGTSNGLIKIENDSKLDYEIFTASEGFFSESFAYLKLYLTDDSTLFVATSRGLKTIKNPPKVHDYPSQIVFNQMAVDGRKILLNQPQPIQLTPNVRTIELSYHYPKLTNRDLLYYQWRMNREQDWSGWSKDRKLVLYHPKPGEYALEIRVKKANQILGVGKLPFVIKTPWFLQPAVLASVLLSVIAVILFWIRKRDQRIKLKQRFETDRALTMATLESKALRAQMNPHFLFNILNNLQEMILSGDTHLAQTYLSKFSRLMRMILNISAKEYVKIEDEIDFLSLYLDLEQLRFDHQFSYDLKIDKDLLSEEIPVFMIQPLVENAIRHGLRPLQKKRHLLISIDTHHDYIQIKVIDNGVGINRNTASDPLNRKNGVRALDLLKNRLEILSQRSGLNCRLVLNKNTETASGVEATLYVPQNPLLTSTS